MQEKQKIKQKEKNKQGLKLKAPRFITDFFTDTKVSRFKMFGNKTTKRFNTLPEQNDKKTRKN